jgi:hypothetical protein
MAASDDRSDGLLVRLGGVVCGNARGVPKVGMGVVAASSRVGVGSAMMRATGHVEGAGEEWKVKLLVVGFGKQGGKMTEKLEDEDGGPRS